MYTIYCDMDGVLVNFKKGYYELTKIDITNHTSGTPEFWQPVDERGAEWWANLEWMPDGEELWNHIKKHRPNILSSPSKSLSSHAGKQSWIIKNLKNQFNNIYLHPRHEKQKFASKDMILIDDLEKTIDEWAKAGGIGILHTSAANTIKQLKDLGL